MATRNVLRRTGLLLASLAASVLVAAAPAMAQPGRLAAVEDPRVDPQVVGDGLGWTEVACLSGCEGELEYVDERRERFSFVLKRRGRRLRRLARLDGRTLLGQSESVGFDASPTHVLRVADFFLDGGGGESTSSSAFAAGRLGGALRRLFRCGEASAPHALAGDLLANDSLLCGGREGGVVVRSLANGSRRTIPAPGLQSRAIALAGDALAAALSQAEAEDEETVTPSAPPKVSVWNWRTGQQLTSIQLAPGADVHDLAVRTDGGLVYATRAASANRNSCTAALRVVQPPGSAPRPLATGVCDLLGLSGDEALARRRDRVVAIRLTGGERDLVRHGRIRLGGVDYESQRIAFELPSCGGDATLHLLPVTGPPRSAGAAECPMSVPRQRLRLGSRRGLRVRLSCPRGCAGVVTLRPRRLRALRRDFELNAGRRSFVLRVPRSVAARLARSRRVPVRIDVAIRDRANKRTERRRRAVLSR